MVQVAEKRGAGSVVCRPFFVAAVAVFAIPALDVFQDAGRHGQTGSAIGSSFATEDVDGAHSDDHRFAGREDCPDMSGAHGQELGACYFGQLTCQPGRCAEVVADSLEIHYIWGFGRFSLSFHPHLPSFRM